MTHAILVLFLALLTAVAAHPVDETTLKAGGWSAVFHDSVLMSLQNRLTGEAFIMSKGGAPTTGARVSRDKVLAVGEAVRVAQRVAVERNDLVVQQEASVEKPPLVGVSWGIAELAEGIEVLVPGHSGLRFGPGAPDGDHRFTWPMSWEAQFVLIQGKRGGFLVMSDDTTMQFKELVVRRRGGRMTLSFETQAHAPFANVRAVKSVTWRLRPYRGSWLEGARLYREWAEKAFDLAAARATQPKWARDIRAVVIVPMEMELLDELAKRLKPEQTLLYVPNWRRDGYDRNYPDYTADAKFGPWNERAHALGFRVMPHVNYFGCDPLHPLYEKFKGQHMRDRFSNEPLWWLWDRAEPVIKFAYINPASRAWRELFVGRMKELCSKHRVDALHLDQTLCIFNDNNGLVDGMNCAQGILDLHRELRAALPDVAISGEGLNEVTYRYEEFAQRHLSGLNHADGTWNDRRIAMAHPISSALLTPHTAIYGYLGMSNPSSGPIYQAWRRGYDHFGVIPTLAHTSTRQLRGSADLLAPFFKEAQFFQRTQALPDFAAPWPKDSLMVYRLADGGKAVLRKESGAVLADANKREIYRRIEGVGEARVPGIVAGWLAYDEKRIFGLDPSQSYTHLQQPRDLKAFHIAALPEGAVVRRASIGEAMATISLDVCDSELARLWDFNGRVAVGVRLQDGVERRSEGRTLQDESGGHVAMESDGIFVHPPWRGAGLPGATFVEYRLRLPDRPVIQFEAGVGLRRNVGGKSDGVTFRVEACAGKERLSAEKHAAAEPASLTLDLSPLRGRDIVLRLEANPGPKGNVNFDQAQFLRPRVVAESHELRKVIVHSPRKPRVALGADGELKLTSAGKNRYAVSLPLPGSFCLLFAEPHVVSLPLDLCGAPHTAALVAADGTESVPHSFMQPAPGNATVGGVKKPALHAHPPANGRMVVDYLLRLPPTPARLEMSAGIRDGSNSAGVGFIVQINGREACSAQLRPGAWKAISADLARYAGQTVVLSLITDAMGDFSFDWAAWGEPRIVVKGP
ncbi:MAG: DUF6259 domain-containing protein [Verrucomicrobia bacterium]|nr:DUF6259 domain-containing protein [Verrucomicrobiota bacterium]